MKFLLLIIILFTTFISLAQNKQSNKKLRIVSIEDTSYAYLLKGVDSTGRDTLHFISIKNYGDVRADAHKIAVGHEYLFRIDDMDYINGLYSPQIAEGYRIKFDTIYVKRNWRNGNTMTTTQYRSINTNGLWINKIE